MKKLFIFIFLILFLTSCTKQSPSPCVDSHAIPLKEKYSEQLRERTFVLGEENNSIFSFDDLHAKEQYIYNTYTFIKEISNKDNLYFEHNISTLDLYFVGLEPSDSQRCKTQILKYDKKSGEKYSVLTAPHIPVYTFSTVAKYKDGYCTGEISADSNGNIIGSNVSQYDIPSSTYHHYLLESKEMPTVCGYDDNSILALNTNLSPNNTTQNISLIDTSNKENKTIISKVLTNENKRLDGTAIYDICSNNKKIYTLETDEHIGQNTKTFIRIYNLKGYLLREYKLDTNKIGSPICIGNSQLCINNKAINLQTNYGFYILTHNSEPFKILSINNNSKNLYYAGMFDKYFVYYEENTKKADNGEVVVHVVDTNTFSDQLYYLEYDDTFYKFNSISITNDNTLVASIENLSSQNSCEPRDFFYYIEDFIQ